MNGFSVPAIDDKSETGCITSFEQKLPLARISLLEFERRLKKLVDPGNDDEITLNQMLAVF